jgi:hypothetical protein
MLHFVHGYFIVPSASAVSLWNLDRRYQIIIDEISNIDNFVYVDFM